MGNSRREGAGRAVRPGPARGRVATRARPVPRHRLLPTATVIALLLLRFVVAAPVMAVVADHAITRLSARETGSAGSARPGRS
ncbi:hypothetical protein ACFXPQ_16640 [Streptomyces lydicus]|uniref:hypothetical protein n=1 Tax=Streptomyces lydicus TaxID=47763 RepID=UPI003696B30C